MRTALFIQRLGGSKGPLPLLRDGGTGIAQTLPRDFSTGVTLSPPPCREVTQAMNSGSDRVGQVTILIGTLNASEFLPRCLGSIRKQRFPEDNIEVLIVDGGSTDSTIEIARGFGARIIHNPLRSNEAARALGVRAAKGEFVLFVDADNELIGDDWLTRMMVPFEDERIAACDAIYWDVQSSRLTAIDRYCGLLGMHDPLNLFLGNYSHYSHLTERWTDLPIEYLERPGYLEIQPPSGSEQAVLPTLGSNGCVVRREAVLEHHSGDYLFDLDLIQQLWQDPRLRTARVPVAIAHYHSRSLVQWAAKSRRAVKDFYYHRELGDRTYPYDTLSRGAVVKFVLYSILVLPTLVQSTRGFLKHRDIAWFLHPICCLVNLMTYGIETMRLTLLGQSPQPFDRDKWR